MLGLPAETLATIHQAGYDDFLINWTVAKARAEIATRWSSIPQNLVCIDDYLEMSAAAADDKRRANLGKVTLEHGLVA